MKRHRYCILYLTFKPPFNYTSTVNYSNKQSTQGKDIDILVESWRYPSKYYWRNYRLSVGLYFCPTHSPTQTSTSYKGRSSMQCARVARDTDWTAKAMPHKEHPLQHVQFFQSCRYTIIYWEQLLTLLNSSGTVTINGYTLKGRKGGSEHAMQLRTPDHAEAILTDDIRRVPILGSRALASKVCGSLFHWTTETDWTKQQTKGNNHTPKAQATGPYRLVHVSRQSCMNTAAFVASRLCPGTAVHCKDWRVVLWSPQLQR